MNDIPPEVWQAIAQVGGTPVLIMFGVWKLWNGTGKRVQRVEERVQQIHDSMVRIEARFDAQDRVGS